MKKLSVKDRAILANGGDLPDPNPPSLDQALGSPKTAPGQMMEFMRQKSDVHARNLQLEARLTEFQDASPTRRIDPTLIVRSKWANRHEQSFSDSDFVSLRTEIESAGGNVQPIKVRPLAGDEGKFEIVFGHRRHQACLDLALPVLAMVTEISDSDLFAEMDRENRQRKDLRPYEQGLMYKMALGEGLFPSAKKMAAALGVDFSNVSKSLALAQLPQEVLGAFSSPLDIQLRWASDLRSIVEKELELVQMRAKALEKQDPRPTPKLVFEYLKEGGVVPNHPPPQKKIIVTGATGQSGAIRLDTGSRSAEITLKNVEPAKLEQLEKLIQTFLS